MPADTSLVPSSIFGRISARTSLTSTRDYKATVQLLDDNETILQEFKKNANAQVILDYVCEFLNIIEKDYFGLRFQDLSKHRYWVDLNKPIAKQMRGPNIGLRFRVRFYPSDVSVLKEEITRYQLFVQLQRDLLHGRLYCPQNEAAVLGALILQSVIGDYNPEAHPPGYVSEYKLLLKQTAKLEEKIAEAHKSFRGLTSAQAEMEFLKHASKLDTYGFDPYTVTDKQGQTMFLGVTHRGIFVYHVSRMVHHITWSELEKLDYLGKELYVTPVPSYVSPYSPIDESNGHVKPASSKAATLKFHCPSASFAKHLWRHILSQQAFFTENDAKHIKPKFSKPRIPLLSRGSTFRFPTSRVLHEIEIEGPGKRDGPAPLFTRYGLQKQPPRQQISFTNKYHTLPSAHPNKNRTTPIPENEPLTEANEAVSAEPTPHVSDEKSEEPVPVPEPVTDLSSSPATSPSNEHVSENVEPVTTSASDESLLGVQLASTLVTTPEKAFSGKERNESSEPCSTVRLPPPAVETNVRPSGNLLSYAARILLSCLLIILLVSALAITIFESDSKWFASFPVMDDLRHSIYEPMRHFVISNYDRIGSRS